MEQDKCFFKSSPELLPIFFGFFFGYCIIGIIISLFWEENSYSVIINILLDLVLNYYLSFYIFRYYEFYEDRVIVKYPTRPKNIFNERVIFYKDVERIFYFRSEPPQKYVRRIVIEYKNKSGKKRKTNFSISEGNEVEELLKKLKELGVKDNKIITDRRC